MLSAFQWPLGYSSPVHHHDDLIELRARIPRFHEARVDCVETAITWGWEEDAYVLYAEELKRLIGMWQDGGIRVWSVHVPGGRTIDISHREFANRGIELVSGYMDVCARMGVDKVVLHPSYEPIATNDRPQRIATAQQSIRALHHPGVRIAVETLPRTCLCNTMAETVALLAPLSGLAYACVDANHCHRDPPEQVIAAVADRLITLHISDDDGLDEKHWYPGKGVLNWNAIIKALEDADYTGCFLYELSGKDEDPMDIRRNFDGLLEAYAQSKQTN